MIIDNEAADIVREIFNMFLLGWNCEIIDRILRDENYTGTLLHGKRRNENYINHKEAKNLKKIE